MGGSLVPVLRSIKWAAHDQSGIGDGLHVDHRLTRGGVHPEHRTPPLAYRNREMRTFS